MNLKEVVLSSIICVSALGGMEREQLEKSAFRKGISVGSQGIMKIAPSDHLPITVTYDDTSIVGWNLLSADFLWNYFREVGEKSALATHKQDGKVLDWRTVLNDFGNFVFDNTEVDKFGIYQIKITKELMSAFLARQRLKQQQLQESLVRDAKYEEKINRSESALKEVEVFVSVVLNTKSPDYQDVKTSIMHALELKYAGSKGYLRWIERLKQIEENKFLMRALALHNFFCFQECTNPQDMLALLRKSSQKDLVMLTHAVRTQSKDNCVIMYDKNNYELENHISFGLASNTKPSIVAKFRSLKTNKSIIVGSIHHSGRGNSELSIIIKKVHQLSQGNMDIPVLVLGDYNHQVDFYKNDIVDTGFNLKMPSDPTMAGLEYGNLNKAIDGVLTNYPAETTVDVINTKAFASQIALPIDIIFEL